VECQVAFAGSPGQTIVVSGKDAGLGLAGGKATSEDAARGDERPPEPGERGSALH